MNRAAKPPSSHSLIIGLLFAILALVLAAVISFAPPAFAATPVELRADVGVRNGVVTLGDVFEGAGAAAPVVIGAAASPAHSVSLDAGRLQQVALNHGLVWTNPRGLRRIIARPVADGGLPASMTLAARSAAARGQKVLAWGRDIGAGEVVQGSDLVWSDAPAFAPSDAPSDSDEVIGMAARRPLRAGAPVSRRDVSAPQVIRKDDLVSVAYSAGGVRLVLQAKALGPAAIGESFSVQNTGSKKLIQAVAVGPGEAVVGPEADRIKAAVRANPKLFASLR